MCFIKRCLTAASAIVLVSAMPTAVAGTLETGEVKDLHYGDVLFYFYQDDYFNAITRLLAAQQMERVPNHQEESELVLGGLYLSYGQHEEAGRIFDRLLDTSVEPDVRNRAWYFLAKIWFHRGYWDKAEEALGKIDAELPKEVEPKRRLLHAQVLMSQGKFDQAIALLDGWKKREDLVSYARYNLGVALVRNGDPEAGIQLLDQVGQMRSRDPELRSLEDKANLALGFTYLQNNQPELARPVLERVRLNGPFSNKALLGVGWADAAQEQYNQALVPWSELQKRDLLDTAVQESLLAMPYAMARLNASQSAEKGYREAIQMFQHEIERLETSITAIQQGRLVDAVLPEGDTAENGWFWSLEDVSDAPESRYLFHLMAGHEFQEALKNYRDLISIQSNLAHWVRSIGAYDEMLANGLRAYDERLPNIQNSFGGMDLVELRQRRDDITAELTRIVESDDTLAFASDQETELWHEIVEMERRLARLDDRPEAQELREKHRLAKGVLIWDLNHEYKARLWKNRKALKIINRELEKAHPRHEELAKLIDYTPQRFAGFEQRIAVIKPQVIAMHDEVVRAGLQQSEHIQMLAVRELEQQKQRLATYLTQARFALAAVYDQATKTAAVGEGG